MPVNKSSLISVIVVNYNGRHLLEACLESLRVQTYPHREVILVDNGSSDGSAAYVKERFPEVKVIRSERNLGFAGGNNLGARHAHGELIALLNNDAAAASDWLEKMLQAFEQPRVAVAMAKVYTEGAPAEYYEKNGTINFLGYNIMRVFEEPWRTFFASGCALVYRRDVVGEVPFDPDYFLYAEDVYLSWHVRLKGWEVVQVPDAVVYHKGSVTARKRRDTVFYQTRNRLLNCLLFYEKATLLKLAPYFAFDFVAGAVRHARLPANLLAFWGGYLVALLGFPAILTKRRLLQAARVVSDGEILQLMSCKLLNEGGTPARFFNGISSLYCRLVGLETMERYAEGRGYSADRG